MWSALDSLEPGQVITFDHRPQVTACRQAGGLTEPLKVAQWNIERGYQLSRIIDILRSLDADVVTLQELDLFCERTEWRNVAEEISKALQCLVVFVVEFWEKDSPLRSHENRCGPQECGSAHRRAVHGNAILSRRHSLQCPTVIRHSWGLDWENDGIRLREPRVGYRSALRCTVGDNERSLFIYSAHLEVFCGALDRVRQFLDVADDAQRQKAECELSGKQFHLFIGGDLNTMAHGIVRFSSKYGTDRMKLLSVGETEGTWFQRKVIRRGRQRWWEQFTNNNFVWRWAYGFTSDEVATLTRAMQELQLYDPFGSYSVITLNNPAYHGFVQGKLDWMLLSNASASELQVINEDYSASDHKGLAAEVRLSSPSLIVKGATEAHVWQRDLWGEAVPYFASRALACAAAVLIARKLFLFCR